MKTNVLNYRIIVSPDEQIGTGKPAFTAVCPTLGIADDGETVEEALKNIQTLISFHLESLQQEGKDIPIDRPDKEFVTNTQVEVSFSSSQFAL
ncbi:MAG: hypothetical protein O3B87_02835 [bacterium]|nr:hypothetical protein [bacterium]